MVKSTMAVGMITCHRPELNLPDAVTQLRAAGFDEDVHLFCEPGMQELPQMAGVVVHNNYQQLGNTGNWRHCLGWMVYQITADYLFINEDDVAFHPSTREKVEQAIRDYPDAGYWSPFTSDYDRPRATKGNPVGWVERNWGWEEVGTQSMCFSRPMAERVLAECTGLILTLPYQGPTDAYLGQFFQEQGIPCYRHYPSLVDHTGRVSTAGRADHRGLNYGG